MKSISLATVAALAILASTSAFAGENDMPNLPEALSAQCPSVTKTYDILCHQSAESLRQNVAMTRWNATPVFGPSFTQGDFSGGSDGAN